MSTAPTRRSLFIIGGAEDKLGEASVLRRFIELAGGTDARIVVIPTASSFADEAVEVYGSVFRRLGAASVDSVDVASRIEADREDPSSGAAVVDRASGVFLTGGNQLKLAQLVVGTALGRAITRAHDRGAVVAGTSAGASIMSTFMISLGEEGITPRQRSSQLTSGLGLLPEVIVDQHFAQRTRYGRLLSLVAGSPNLLGLGIDEDTAAEVTDGRLVTVLGTGSVFVIDGRRAVTDAHEAAEDAPLLVSGAVVHALPQGAIFDLGAADLIGFSEQHPDRDVMAVEHEHPDGSTVASATGG
ncbi:cyanophycinase [Arsenicicoccus piscis]|uniref:Cyanophycinase n=1 Tax=Arsenicicoccus piscis TaxID=673954 RepID=A0ABQ6HMX8_9MICO|nr:cyanophycinase [Arsenicicoccus piscis]MCH8629234.1 cyanophycinase [Arsenicicoccus piscis]GMA19811.1 cyanophycinase [Arsenicicoccus piscis]